MITGFNNFRVRPLAPLPPKHTSDPQIFKIPFESKNLGKLSRSESSFFPLFAP